MKEEQIRETACQAKAAKRILASCSRERKDAFLEALADALVARTDEIVTANMQDLEAGRKNGLSQAMLDRLALDDKRVQSMAEGVRAVAALSDPVGTITGMTRRPNGLLLGRMRVPLGVVAIIYESRPNVTVDAAILCFKAGNASILRGGSEAVNSNVILGKIMAEVLQQQDLPAAAINVLASTERRDVEVMLGCDKEIDLVIPRGGAGLIRTVRQVSQIPVIAHLDGVCHVYVDAEADLAMAEEICFNAKVQRPGVCNAIETLLVNTKVASEFIPMMVKRLCQAGVELRGCARAQSLSGETMTAATEEDWYAEYLDLILAVRVVDTIEEAIEHIAKYGSQHSDAIVTQDYASAQQFINEVDSAAVYVNASTRFTDGAEFGLGAEIGISTQKLHCRGPMGLEELTSSKFIIYGNGQVRN